MKLYDLILRLLTSDESLRYDDRRLIWLIWEMEGFVSSHGGYEFISKDRFLNATDFETIRRTRQRVMQDHPEIGRAGKTKKESSKGMFVYHKKAVFNDKEGTVRFI